MFDDLGYHVPLAHRVRRVVSLVPSLTEAVAASGSDLLVGATDWCVQPAGLDVVRVRGTKNPDLAKITELRPDLVLANFEENRTVDLDALRAAGLPVWCTMIRTLPEALDSLDRMLTACGIRASWPAEVRHVWADVLTGAPSPVRHAAVPIWRRPWMVLGRDTFAGDVLARLGIANVYGTADDRYPRTTVQEIRESGADLIVLPDEPYAFGPDDGPEYFTGTRTALLSGRYLTWYGPSLCVARAALSDALFTGERPGRDGDGRSGPAER